MLLDHIFASTCQRVAGIEGGSFVKDALCQSVEGKESRAQISFGKITAIPFRVMNHKHDLFSSCSSWILDDSKWTGDKF